ncbi:MAG: tetratricopeptide repeat protein [Bacteroidales bacterium]|nr:tetratricopeptide repeat protein [Bacteroidales bacterium]
MEILKKKLTISLLFLLAAFVQIQAQNGKNLQEAFAASYKAETAGEYTRAIELLRKEYNENSYEINIRLGWLTYNNGSFTESAAYYSKAIQLMPYSIEARLGFALPASAIGNWDQVVTKYQEILKIDPNHYLTNYRMGLIYYYREDYQTAIKYFERIANMYPFDYDAVQMFAWANFRIGKTREARALFSKALLIRPGDASALEGLGMIK